MARAPQTVELDRVDAMDLVAIVERITAARASDGDVAAAAYLDAHEERTLDRVRRALR